VRIADLILPVFGVIVTGWIAGWTGYVSRGLSDALIHFSIPAFFLPLVAALLSASSSYSAS
jgi:malonate transporter